MSTLEAFASGGAIARRYKRVNGAREVMQLAESGDQRARKIVISSATALGAALAWAVSLVDPQVVVLGGGVGARGGEWLEIVRDRYSSLGAQAFHESTSHSWERTLVSSRQHSSGDWAPNASSPSLPLGCGGCDRLIAWSQGQQPSRLQYPAIISIT